MLLVGALSIISASTAAAQDGPLDLLTSDGVQVTFDDIRSEIADVRIRIPEPCHGAGRVVSFNDTPGNLKTPIVGNQAIGGPSNFTCVPDQRTTLDRFNVNVVTGQFFADLYCMDETAPPSQQCFPVFLEDLLLPSDCEPGPTAHCLQNGRFKVEATWRDFADNRGDAQAVPLQSDDSGIFYFFEPDNTEMLFKVLDGCGFNERYWVFFAATTNVEFEVTVTDTGTGQEKRYDNTLGQPAAPVLDTQAFATCP
ncbi:MAG: hypothetical protein DWQ36_03950 [Acidobacteria bacterium]|nr:MAG: hypothetical protein DWQ30_25205 [Acidobacteriota bacterium]REK10575.1 MAG: hypothetical protein DWQ36_03950 [Acidobacteriota bacterium]